MGDLGPERPCGPVSTSWGPRGGSCRGEEFRLAERGQRGARRQAPRIMLMSAATATTRLGSEPPRSRARCPVTFSFTVWSRVEPRAREASQPVPTVAGTGRHHGAPPRTARLVEGPSCPSFPGEGPERNLVSSSHTARGAERKLGAAPCSQDRHRLRGPEAGWGGWGAGAQAGAWPAGRGCLLSGVTAQAPSSLVHFSTAHVSPAPSSATSAPWRKQVLDSPSRVHIPPGHSQLPPSGPRFPHL